MPVRDRRSAAAQCFGAMLLMRRWDAPPSRSAPVLGRSNESMPKGLGKPVRLGAIRRCCARGRAHSAVAYPAALAVCLCLAVVVGRAAPVAIPGQTITLPVSAGAPYFADVEGHGRCDLFVLDQAEKTLWRFRQRPNGFTNSPDQIIPLAPQTAWVALADVDAHPGLELLMSTATGVVYSRQEGGRFEAERRPLITAHQVFTNGDFPGVATLATNPAGSGVLIPVISAEQTVLYHRNPAYEWTPDPPLNLKPQAAHWYVDATAWAMGSGPAHSLNVYQAYLAKPDSSREHDLDDNAGTEAIQKFLSELSGHGPWPPHMLRRDVTGDGREDLVVWQQGGNLDLKTDIYVFLRGVDGRLPERPAQILHCRGMTIPLGSTGVFNGVESFPPVHDLKGDGRCELVLLELKTRITSASGFIETMLAHGLEWSLTIRTFQQGAFSINPDASVPLRAVLPAEILTERPIFIDGDFNGDGRPDLLVQSSDSQFNIYFSTTDGSWFAPEPALTFEAPGRGWLEVKGLTGDGRSDVLWHDSDRRILTIFRSPSAPTGSKNP